jgi:hypothetical protein
MIAISTSRPFHRVAGFLGDLGIVIGDDDPAPADSASTQARPTAWPPR